MALTDHLPPADLLPPELTPDAPMDREELDALLSWVDTMAEAEKVEPAEFVAGLVAGAYEPDDDKVTEAIRYRWKIRSEAEAEWAMRHLAAAAANRDALEAQRRAYIERIEAWSRDAMRKVERDLSFFGGHLEAWGIEQRLRNPKQATLSLPSGKVRTTNVSPTVAVEDEFQVVSWALDALDEETLPEVVQTKRKVLMRGLRAHVAVGEQPTGRWVITLACGCALTAEDVADPEAIRNVTLDCEVWPEHGTQDVTSVLPETVQVPVDPDGTVVPGAGIIPAHVTATATPDP